MTTGCRGCGVWQLRELRSKLVSYRGTLLKSLKNAQVRIPALETEVNTIRAREVKRLKLVYTWGTRARCVLCACDGERATKCPRHRADPGVTRPATRVSCAVRVPIAGLFQLTSLFQEKTVLEVRLARVNVEVECAMANALETRIAVRRASPPLALSPPGQAAVS